MLAALALALRFLKVYSLVQEWAQAIVCGLVVSQVLTLFTTPVVYLWFGRLSTRLRPMHVGQAALQMED